MSAPEKAFISELDITERFSELSFVAVAPVVPVNLSTNISVNIQPSINNEPDIQFKPVRSALTYNKLSVGISVEQSGQSITLPILVDSHPGLSDESVDIRPLLTHWMSRDLNPLLLYLHIAQQETGWSDYELLQLTQLYVSSQLTKLDQTAFLYSLWNQAGFDVNLALVDRKWVSFVRLPSPIPGVPLVYKQGSYWLAMAPWLDPDQKVMWYQPVESVSGQSLGLNALNDRAAGDELFSKDYRFDGIDKSHMVQFRLPVHWASVASVPAPVVTRYRQRLPDELLSGFSILMPDLDLKARTESVVNWLRMAFTDTDSFVSVHQMLVSGVASNESRFVMLSQWWSTEASNPSALLILDGKTYLALRLPKRNQYSDAVTFRGHQWWVWSSNLQSNVDSSILQADWLFLP